MEFMNNGDLEGFIKVNKSLGIRISEEKLWDIFFKCLSGLNYIHKQGLIHRDIKPQNLFIDDEFNIKIGFNISFSKNADLVKNFLQSNDVNDVEGMIVSCRGAEFQYKAPEKIPIKYDEKIDVYSMGIVFFELSYGCHPYQSMVIKENLYNQNIYSNE